MLLQIAATFFTLVLSLVTALPTPSQRISREVQEPVQVPASTHSFSVTQTKGSRSLPSNGVQLDQCVPLETHFSFPSTLHITPASGVDHILSFFALKTFDTPDCADGSILSTRSLSNVAPTLNQRRPICSFSLGTQPFPNYPVTVSFTYHGGNSAERKYLEDATLEDPKHCIEVCGEDKAWEARFPKSVAILEKDGGIANNHLKLFSGNGCQSATVFSDLQSEPLEIEHGSDLLALTQTAPRRATHFMISRGARRD